jgi:hypothetical protein
MNRTWQSIKALNPDLWALNLPIARILAAAFSAFGSLAVILSDQQLTLSVGVKSNLNFDDSI